MCHEFLFEKFPDMLCDGGALFDFAVSEDDDVVDFVLPEETSGHFELEGDRGQVIREDGQAVIEHEDSHHDLASREEIANLFDIHFQRREVIFIPGPKDDPIRAFNFTEEL